MLVSDVLSQHSIHALVIIHHPMLGTITKTCRQLLNEPTILNMVVMDWKYDERGRIVLIL